jgi:hypothetical protein
MSINRAGTIADVQIKSVLYCHTRGPSAYPFLIVHLLNPYLYARPIVLKIRGYDGPLTAWEDNAWTPGDTSDECSTFTLARVGQSIRELVGTRRYDVCHTMKCRKGVIDGLLVLAELSTEQDRSRAIYPATLFLALENYYQGTVTSSTKRRARAAPLPKDVAQDTTTAVIGAFPARRQRMMQLMDLWRGF